MTVDSQRILGFLVFGLAFVTILTLVVRLARLHVRGKLAYTKGLGMTALFVGLILVIWWFLTRGEPGERIVQSLILPSPMEVLRAFGPLHFERGLVRSTLTSWLRVTTEFTLVPTVPFPHPIYMATVP